MVRFGYNPLQRIIILVSECIWYESNTRKLSSVHSSHPQTTDHGVAISRAFLSSSSFHTWRHSSFGGLVFTPKYQGSMMISMIDYRCIGYRIVSKFSIDSEYRNGFEFTWCYKKFAVITRRAVRKFLGPTEIYIFVLKSMNIIIKSIFRSMWYISV